MIGGGKTGAGGHTDDDLGGRKHPEVYGLLWLTGASAASVAEVLISQGIKPATIQRKMHLTVYYARRLLPTLRLGRRSVTIVADMAETRLMVLAPGGERPRDDLDPRRQSIGLRLTKRNRAIEEIQALRRDMYRLETPAILGHRKATTAWKNAFGARNYQPHITIMGPHSGTSSDLSGIGKALRSSLRRISFDAFEVRYRP